MTAVDDRPSTRAGASGSGRPPSAGSVHPGTALVVATGLVAAGMLLTALPLSSVFTDWGWLGVSIGCALPYLVIVAALRYRGTARWWHSLLGLLASVAMLLWVFVPQHLAFGVLPTSGTDDDLFALYHQLHRIVQAEHAPLASSPPLRLLVAIAVVGLTLLTDVLAVVMRQPLLASAPLLEVLAVASATSSRSADPLWFAAAAVGFLLILLAGTRLQDAAWGPSVDGSAGRLGGGRRMAVTGIVAALLVPLLLPAVPTNLLARAAHHDGTGDGSGSGPGTGRVVLNGLTSLRGSLLRQQNPVSLFTVHVGNGQEPFYVRQDVDDVFTNDGWRPTPVSQDRPPDSDLDSSLFFVEPRSDDRNYDTGSNGGIPTFDMDATFTIDALGGETLPLLANPFGLRVPGDRGSWDSSTATVNGAALRHGTRYTESVRQPAPSVSQLRSAPEWTPSGDGGRYLALPQQPAEVTDLAQRLIIDKRTPYDQAKAISDYFTDGRNGFTYSLEAPPEDGLNALVSFLRHKVGFCQQYASAAAVLMRAAGLPTRVVIGYTHQPPDADGNFTVTTSDAHSWVEVYFTGIGWIPFDPTPLSGADTGRAVALPWATHAQDTPTTSAEPAPNRPSAAPSDSATESAAPVADAKSDSLVPPLVWRVGLPVAVVLVLLLAIGLGPRSVRGRQRRRRLARARVTGNPEPLWLELAATATDREALWPPTVTVGQVPAWLGRHGVDERGQAAVGTIAATVERDRFSGRPVSELPDDTIRALNAALTRWSRNDGRRLNRMSRWLPRSLVARQARWRR